MGGGGNQFLRRIAPDVGPEQLTAGRDVALQGAGVGWGTMDQ